MGGSKEDTLCNIEIYRLACAQKSKHGYKTPLQSNLSYSLLMILVTLRNWSKLIISNTFFVTFFKKIFWDHIFDTHIYIPWSKQTDLTLAILNKSAKNVQKIKQNKKIWKHKLKIFCIAEIYLKRVLGRGCWQEEKAVFLKMSSACLFQIMQKKGHLSAFKVFHRQFTPASLDTIVVAVPPSAR